MYQKEVETKNGVIKTIVANTEEELAEAVKIAKGEGAPAETNPHTEPAPVFINNAVDEPVVEPEEVKVPVKVTKKK